MESFLHASGFSKKVIGIPNQAFYILRNAMPKRLSLGKYLEKVRKEEFDLTLKQAVERSRQFRAEMGPNSIRDIEIEKTLNPGILTVEAIARVYNLDPLEVIAFGLAEPPELTPGYSESRFAALYKAYSKLPKKQQRFIDDYIETLIKRIAESR